MPDDRRSNTPAALEAEVKLEVAVRDLCNAIVMTRRGSADYYKLSTKLRDTLNDGA